mmetsp:Transcript_56111/g.63501  ORF Transcript_56111/g.63501 Transcript_56111/m.63501 type:complete len:135 (+) Transcript_56111:3-407(+)
MNDYFTVYECNMPGAKPDQISGWGSCNEFPKSRSYTKKNGMGKVLDLGSCPEYNVCKYSMMYAIEGDTKDTEASIGELCEPLDKEFDPNVHNCWYRNESGENCYYNHGYHPGYDRNFVIDLRSVNEKTSVGTRT